MPCAADAGSARCALQNAARLTTKLLTPTTPKRTTDTSERRRTSVDKLDGWLVGGMGGVLISPRTGPFCSTGGKSPAAAGAWGEQLPTRSKMGFTRPHGNDHHTQRTPVRRHP